ncbi:MAG: DUF1223 domain-containing protein [Deltaproteobacteria bacterium]|nr:MAG: DUF1223 domain-containing protein [Deltaproteobacteria bacterium]TMB25849.1 MAG: DUF1223 domain-containing protein [Deltaproteobacteria bacterium]TMB38555.1 MAG: DUF1223 domain-containing protein [Deltaproteobacteria bacterium]
MPLLIAALLAASPVPVLVELFTSEGCSSCPPADAVLARLVRAQPVPGATVVGLSEHVDYWNSLGWKDPFSDALFTDRQQDYASVIARGRVYTPQMVVGGSVDVLGSDERAARSAVARAAAEPHGTLRLERRGKGVHVAGQDFPAHADAHVLFAVVEDGLSNRVLRGENQGRTLTHEAVVRSLQRIGLASGPSFELDVQPTLEASWKAPRFVAFVQELKSRKVLAAAELGP